VKKQKSYARILKAGIFLRKGFGCRIVLKAVSGTD